MPNIKAGIGIATSIDLVVKAGRKGSNINNLVWIVNAVSFGAGLSSLANKYGNERILMTKHFYDGVIKLLKSNNPNKDVESWFTYKNDSVIGDSYGCDVVKSAFDNWVDNGMK